MSKSFLVKKPVKLSKISTKPPKGTDRRKIEKETKRLAKRIADLQEMLYANQDKNLLVVFQGMDSSGKDGSTREAFKYCSLAGVAAYSFKKPTELEFAHDFLWRCHKLAPRKGHIQVFIRSHYEDVLIQRVHKWIDEERVNKRIDAINNWERLLEFDNNTTVLKIYLHLSKERQGEKLKERTEEKDKFWKHNPADFEERKYWDQYREVYEDTINRSEIPWHIVPVDSRWYRNYCVTKIIHDTLVGFKLKWPPLSKE
ncbi:MAG: polyphosphate kinase [Saprospiraceae bacterium]|nr:polyphosphate kinase [Saprospiraceae bacterium]